MNKEFMLASVKHRLKELEQNYALACDNVTRSGRRLTKSGGACYRSRLKRDICTLKLVRELLASCTAEYIMDVDAADGFDRLIKGTC